ncbi:MAG: energy-coupled thiamine transporter ThiT [Oscillospiraceae bacterium]
MAGGGLFAAIAAMLQLVGSAIRFGPFSISLVLIPIVLGAALYGWGMGCWLGLVFGAVVLLSGDAGLFLAADPGGAIVTVLSKGIACGAAAGLCCRWLHPRYPRLSILLSALAAPLVNTGRQLGCPCTLVITGGLGRFVAPLCRREAVYDEDLLLRGLWKRCTVNCPSADKP